MVEKTRVIRFRMNEQMYDYIYDLVLEMRKSNDRWNISEFLRMIISYFLMAHMMGEIRKPFWQVKDEFIKYANTYFPPKRKSSKAQKRPRRQKLLE